MNYFEIYKGDEFYGTLITQLSAEKIEELFKQYFEEDYYEDMMDDFVDFLILRGHDTEANRFFVDDVIRIK